MCIQNALFRALTAHSWSSTVLTNYSCVISFFSKLPSLSVPSVVFIGGYKIVTILSHRTVLFFKVAFTIFFLGLCVSTHDDPAKFFWYIFLTTLGCAQVYGDLFHYKERSARSTMTLKQVYEDALKNPQSNMTFIERALVSLSFIFLLTAGYYFFR